MRQLKTSFRWEEDQNQNDLIRSLHAYPDGVKKLKSFTDRVFQYQSSSKTGKQISIRVVSFEFPNFRAILDKSKDPVFSHQSNMIVIKE